MKPASLSHLALFSAASSKSSVPSDTALPEARFQLVSPHSLPTVPPEKLWRRGTKPFEDGAAASVGPASFNGTPPKPAEAKMLAQGDDDDDVVGSPVYSVPSGTTSPAGVSDLVTKIGARRALNLLLGIPTDAASAVRQKDVLRGLILHVDKTYPKVVSQMESAVADWLAEHAAYLVVPDRAQNTYYYADGAGFFEFRRDENDQIIMRRKLNDRIRSDELEKMKTLFMRFQYQLRETGLKKGIFDERFQDKFHQADLSIIAPSDLIAMAKFLQEQNARISGEHPYISLMTVALGRLLLKIEQGSVSLESEDSTLN